MAPPSLPTINTLVDITLLDGSSHPSRVEDVDDRLYTVAAPFAITGEERPDLGTLLELTWLAGGGRLGAPARLIGLNRVLPSHWQLRITGEATRQSRRAYVRGGGGERVALTRLTGNARPVDGHVVDVSEGGLRCRVRAGDFDKDQRLDITLTLDDESVQIGGRVLFVRHNPESDDHDLVVQYDLTEAAGRMIRGYVLRRQMEERRRA